VTEGPFFYSRPERAPAHFWVLGFLLVLWNGWGVAVAIAAQTDRLPTVDAQASAYFEAQPLWFVIFADLGPLAGIAGAVALLLQSRWATWLFVVQLAVIALANAYEVAIGTSLLLSNDDARVMSLVIAVMMIGQILYARAMRRRGVLS
jgi:hypothetical protein